MPDLTRHDTRRSEAVTDTSSARSAPPIETTTEVMLELVEALKSIGASDEVVRAAEDEVRRLQMEKPRPA